MRSLLLLSLVCAALPVRAQEAGRLLAIQQKKYQLNHELEIGGMFEPQDAFSKGVGAEGAYVWHFGEAWGWEVLRGGYVAQLDTGLKQQLVNEFGVIPTQFESLQWYVSSSLMWSPLYGKFALRNASLVHAEAFVDLGAALGHFTSSFEEGPQVGVGARVFLSQSVSLRLDARDTAFFHRKTEGGILTQVVMLSLGLSISLGGNGG
ncbi:MAG TPA: outer membrane beta-barrel domain-containing protein [Myxococcales bacterium]|nr:outer membrane beta-barrel domain-containing protein [Myxococcales bacterium]